MCHIIVKSCHKVIENVYHEWIDHTFTQQGLYHVSRFLPNSNRQQNIIIKVRIESSEVRDKVPCVQPRKPGSLYLRGLRLRPWFRLVTWDFMNLLPKGEREKYQITCFHIKTLHFICKEWDIYYLLTETKGNSVFCGPETVDVSRGEAEGNIDGRGSTKHTAFPRSQSISVLLYINSQRNNKLKNK